MFDPPTAGEWWLRRPELVGALSDTAARLVLVNAPAGSGKTVLVAQWCASLAGSRRCGWVCLDARDNDPARLWWHVVSALQQSYPELRAGDVLRWLWAVTPDAAGTLLPVLVNELAALSVPVVLVLDNYHVITARSCVEQIEFLLHNLPPSARLVLMTRAAPQLPLARLRAAGDLAEIRAQQLRFTPAEAAALVHAIAAVTLDEEQTAELAERTEGWAAGIHMAALTLRGSTSPGEAIGQFSGTNRYVADFFMREVVGRQPTRVQRFLMRTAILDRFTARLCDQVTQIPGCAEIIARLDRDSVFLVPLDDQRMWYRYHHLFAETLRGQLARAEPGLERVLHERASAWHREHGSAEAAMEHALATADIPGAASVIARHWYTLASAGRVNAVRTQLAMLGEDHIAGDPAAAHSAAWTAALSGDHATARRWLKVVETAEHEGPLPDGTPSLEFSAALLRGSFGFDGLRVMRESASAAVAMETNSRSPWHTLARTVLGASLYLTGDIGAAGTALDEALLNAPAAALTRLLALGIGARVAAEQGRLTQAARRAGLARQVMEEAGLTATAQSSQVWMAAGEIHARQGRLDEARSEFEQALRARQLWPGGGPWPNVEIRLSLARVLTDMGDRPLAVAHLAQARAALALLPDGTEALQARLGQLQQRLAGTPPGPLAEPLTSREEAILRLLGGTRSLREIGQELFLSRNTIKTHTRNIYRKLGATTREDAVQRAREHGICQ